MRAARSLSLVLWSLRIERSDPSCRGNIPDLYGLVGGHHELLAIRRPRQEVHFTLLSENRALPGLADVPKNHREFPAVRNGQRVPSGDQARLDIRFVEENGGPMTRDALRDVPDANHARLAPDRNIRVVGRPGEPPEVEPRD